MEGDAPIGHPIQRKDFDLSTDPRELRRDGKEAPVLAHGDRSDQRTPEAMMRQMGFEPSENMTPLQFLIAVYNDDLDKIFKDEKRRSRMKTKGGLALSYRIEAAKTTAKFLHQEAPKPTAIDTGGEQFAAKLEQAMAEGNLRITQRETILERVMQIAPDVPLAPASYPPDFAAIDAQIVERGNDDEEEEDFGDPDGDPDAE